MQQQDKTLVEDAKVADPVSRSTREKTADKDDAAKDESAAEDKPAASKDDSESETESKSPGKPAASSKCNKMNVADKKEDCVLLRMAQKEEVDIKKETSTSDSYDSTLGYNILQLIIWLAVLYLQLSEWKFDLYWQEDGLLKLLLLVGQNLQVLDFVFSIVAVMSYL